MLQLLPLDWTDFTMVGVGAATAYLIPWSLLPDAIDADPEQACRASTPPGWCSVRS